jgi:Ca-activated chloride channel family protein
MVSSLPQRLVRIAGLLIIAALPVHAQVSVSARPWAANVIMPQTRAFATVGTPGVEITEVSAEVVLLEQAATTALDVSVRNPGPRRTEAELLVPVPDGAVVRGFTFQGSSSEPTAQLLPRDEARRIYDSIVAKVRDPALLEFAGYNLVRTSVFPVEPNATQKVRLTYEHLLIADGDRVDYVLPRSESLGYRVPWNISVQIRSKQPVATVYSPSHPVDVTKLDLRSRHDATVPAGHLVSVKLTAEGTHSPGAFRLSYLRERGDLTASLLAYPDAKVGGGYFLMLAGLPAVPKSTASGPAIRREVTLVLDRSGSMNGEKIQQAREAVLQVLSGLEPGEAFRLLVYNEAVEPYSTEPITKTEESIKQIRAFVEGIQARGGTNLHEALKEALRPKPEAGLLPLVLFLTDGLPTVGQTSEAAIRDLALKNNPHERRIFTFGVGVDVNTPLLEKIATETRAAPTFVLPGENVEVKVSQVFKRLAGPVLADAKLEVVTESGSAAPGRVRDLMPARLPDLYEGDQLVLLGQYVGDDPLTFQVSGNYLGGRRVFRFSFGLEKATARNAFVPRLWASRKIAVLVDSVRQMGAESPSAGVASFSSSSHLGSGLPSAALSSMGGSLAASAAPVTSSQDSRLKELVDEIVRLSTEFGILTEYTAFLAHEGTDLSKRAQIISEANGNFVNRAIAVRSGWGSLNQTSNSMFMANQANLNFDNGYVDQQMNRVAITTVQQIADRAFFRKNNRWVDSRIVEQESSLAPRRTIEFGSEEFRGLAERLASEGRQGCIALAGDVLMIVDGEPVLVKSPLATSDR